MRQDDGRMSTAEGIALACALAFIVIQAMVIGLAQSAGRDDERNCRK